MSSAVEAAGGGQPTVADDDQRVGRHIRRQLATGQVGDGIGHAEMVQVRGDEPAEIVGAVAARVDQDQGLRARLVPGQWGDAGIQGGRRRTESSGSPERGNQRGQSHAGHR